MNRLGLSMPKLMDENAVRFFDIDGVLCIYAFGQDGIGADLRGMSYEDFLKKEIIYTDNLAPTFMKSYFANFCDPKRTYIISRAFSEKEKWQKIYFIKRNYKNFNIDNIIFVEEKSDKVKTARKILDTYYDGLNTPHFAIDDSVDILYDYQDAGIQAIHNSSLYVLANMKGSRFVTF